VYLTKSMLNNWPPSKKTCSWA